MNLHNSVTCRVLADLSNKRGGGMAGTQQKKRKLPAVDGKLCHWLQKEKRRSEGARQTKSQRKFGNWSVSQERGPHANP